MSKSRTNTVTHKTNTMFGSLYIHIHLNDLGQPCGGWISDPGKEPDSQITQFIREISTGLNEALKEW